MSVQFFLVGMDSECFKTYFEMKLSKSKIFPVKMFFSWDSAICSLFQPFWWKNESPTKKNTREKIFDFEIFALKWVLMHSELENRQSRFLADFLSESIQNASKRILNRKIQNRNFFPCNFFSGTLSFIAKMATIVKLTVKIFWSNCKNQTSTKGQNQLWFTCLAYYV